MIDTGTQGIRRRGTEAVEAVFSTNLPTGFPVRLLSIIMSSKDNERYYLLPGMGGAGRRQKVKGMLGWGIAVGLLVSSITATALYLFHHFAQFSP